MAKVTSHYHAVKKTQGRGLGDAKALGQKREASCSPPSAFPSDFLQSFSFKKEEDGGQSSSLLSEEVISPSVRRRTRSSEKARLDTINLHEATCNNSASQPSRLIKQRKRSNSKESIEYLPEVPDHIKEDVDILIIGSNPGRMSSQKCQHFSHPSNHFYRALHRSNLTPTQISPSQDYTLLSQSYPYFSIGLTNLVARPTRMAQDLNKSEEAVGTEILLDLIRKYRPKVGIFVGIGVSRSFERSLSQLHHLDSLESSKKEQNRVKIEEGQTDSVVISVAKEVPLVSDKYLGLGVGLMNVAVRHYTEDTYTLLYSMPSTSGRVTTHQLKEKAESMSWARILTSQLGMDTDENINNDSRHNVSIRLI